MPDVIHSCVMTVMRKFPEHKKAIRRLLKDKDEFFTLCRDYQVCKEALGYWNASPSDQAPLRSIEYSALLQELETEILQNVHEININACN